MGEELVVHTVTKPTKKLVCGINTPETTTGPEILQQAGALIDGWVAAVGTGCTLMGVAHALKSANPAMECAAVEPANNRLLVGETISKPRHRLQGIGCGIVPPHWDASLMDLSLAVSDEKADFSRSQLACKEGLYLGYSAAANVCAASKLPNSGRLESDAEWLEPFRKS